MRSNYAHLILLDLVIYETHRSEYDPAKNVQDFWDKYPLSTIKDYIVVLHPDMVDNEKMRDNSQLTEFSVELLRTLIAYLIIHTHKMDLGKISISLDINREVIESSKIIYDFFQRVSPSHTSP